jgi:FMN reductase
LRPLFSFFQACTLPIGVYASEGDFTGYSVTNAALRERIALAANRALPWLRDAREPAILAARPNAIAA